MRFKWYHPITYKHVCAMSPFLAHPSFCVTRGFIAYQVADIGSAEILILLELKS